MPELIFLRHGQSEWNADRRFTGWREAPLTDAGRLQARRAAELLSENPIDIAYVSAQSRAQETLEIVLSENHSSVPVVTDPSWNERHYGILQGMTRFMAESMFGEKQVAIWRRDFFVAPPGGESLQETMMRVIPRLLGPIAADIEAGRNVIVASHGNSLRAAAVFLERTPPDEAQQLRFPTGVPVVYVLDKNMRIISKEALS